MGQTMSACLPCGGGTMGRPLQLFAPLDPAWQWNDSTANLQCSTRPGGVLEEAEQSPEFTQHLGRFEDPRAPLDMIYCSLSTLWLHQSNIPQRSCRLVRTLDDATGEVHQLFYLDDVLEGTWEFEAPTWLGLARNSARYAGSVRWYDAVPGTYGWVHRSDIGSEPYWQVTLVPLAGGPWSTMRPLP